jgi:hypothetical protein
MNRRPRILAAVAVAAIAAGGLSIAVAQALTPPAGTPDLAKMGVQSSDLGPGSTLLGGRYVKPSKHVIAVYDSGFGPASTTAGVALAAVTSGVALADSTADGRSLFKAYRLIFTSKFGRVALAAEIVKGAGKLSGVTLKDVHFGKQVSAGVGAQSLIQPLTVAVKHKGTAADFVVLRIGAVLASVTVIVTRPHLPSSIATTLAKAVGSHIDAVLAAIGSTGSTGATGSTGSTGATG